LPDVETAYLEAFQAATEMWIEALAEVRNPSRERFEIRDASGRVVLELPFSEILQSGKGARRPAPTFAALRKAADRTHSLQIELASQIKDALSNIRETKDALARLERSARGPR
jgi:hypothetical protein